MKEFFTRMMLAGLFIFLPLSVLYMLGLIKATPWAVLVIGAGVGLMVLGSAGALIATIVRRY